MKRFFGALVTVPLLIAAVRSSRPVRVGATCADQQLVIYLVDSAGIPARNLEQATRRAARILSTTGTAITWRQNSGQSGPSINPARTIFNAGVHLRIAATAPAGFRKGTLAYSMPAVRTGANVTIFYDRVKRVSQDVEIDSATVLGLVMAHEIGHILLRSVKHSSAGIMRSPWTKSDIQHAAARLAEFTSLERSVIRQCAFPEMLSDARPGKPANPRHEGVFSPE